MDKLVFGQTPANVLAAEPRKMKFIVHSEDTLCSLEYPAMASENKIADVYRIWITDNKNPEWQQDSFSTFAIAEVFETSKRGTKAPELVCVDRASIHVATLDYTGGPQNVHRRLTTGGTPTRVVYSEHLNKLIVLTHEVSIIRSPRTVGGRRLLGKRALQPVITFVDPDRDKSACLDDGTMDVDMDNESGATIRNRRQYLEAQRCRNVVDYTPGEKFLGITEWFPKFGDHVYHMLVVNTFIRADEQGNPSGRLLIFAVQNVDGGVQIALKKKTVPFAPVYAVAAHPDRRSIVYCSNQELCIIGLEPNEISGQTPKWGKVTKAPLRSPGRHITIEHPFIYVSTAGESLAVFLQKLDSIEYLSSDTIARQGLHHINIPSFPLTIMADMGGSITGLWGPPEPRIDNSLSTIFEACLPHTVIRLNPVRRPVWSRKDFAEDLDEPMELLLAQRALIGTSTVGTITQHTILLEQRWLLLRFIQNLAERSTIVCPFRDAPAKQHLDPARSTKPQSRAIDGDILSRLLERGGAELLRCLMNKPPRPVDRFLDFADTEERWKRLCELCGNQISMSQDERSTFFETARKSEKEVTKRICEWMTILLKSAL